MYVSPVDAWKLIITFNSAEEMFEGNTSAVDFAAR